MNVKYPKARQDGRMPPQNQQQQVSSSNSNKPRRPSSVVTSAWAVQKAKEKGLPAEEQQSLKESFHQRPSYMTPPLQAVSQDDASSIASSSLGSSRQYQQHPHHFSGMPAPSPSLSNKKKKKQKNHVASSTPSSNNEIWKTLQDAKDRQQAIRDRVKSYSSDENSADFHQEEQAAPPQVVTRRNPYEDDDSSDSGHQQAMALPPTKKKHSHQPPPRHPKESMKQKIPLQKKNQQRSASPLANHQASTHVYGNSNGRRSQVSPTKKPKQKAPQPPPASPSVRSHSSKTSSSTKPNSNRSKRSNEEQAKDDDSARPLTGDEAVRLVME